MKTVIQALHDEVVYPIPKGKIENIALRRGLNGDAEYTGDIAAQTAYKGALADCLFSLLQAINFSEGGMSVGALTDAQRKAILKWANRLYGEIGEDEKEIPGEPMVEILH